MRILLTNDDGIFAPGLRALRRELQKMGDVTVVAPASEQSAAGHSVTLRLPLFVEEVFDTDDNQPLGWSVEGRPVDCTKLAIMELLPEPPDLVVSGMNNGSNAGINVLYSGTVAAAVEAAFYRHTAIAISLAARTVKPDELAEAAGHARTTIERILAQSPPAGSLFNVNIPGPAAWPVKGIIAAAQNVATPYVEQFERRRDPRGRTYFWYGPDYDCPEPHPDTDEPALRDGYITVTPLHFDLTDRAQLERMRAWELNG